MLRSRGNALLIARCSRHAQLFLGLAACLLLIPHGSLFAAPEAPEAHRLQAGDVVEVGLWNQSNDGSVKELTVDATGAISYETAGMLMVAGLTTAEVTERIVAVLHAKGLRNPEVTVTLKSVRRVAPVVYILGAVKKAGPLPLEFETRVTDAIGLAGGLAPDANAARAVINRPGKGLVPVALDKLLQGESAENPLLNAGDTLTVPALQSQESQQLKVLVVGQVNRPGSVRLAPGTRLIDAVVAAGGPTPIAGLKNASLARNGAVTTVDLDAVFRQGKLDTNQALQDGDVLSIPEAPRNSIILLGQFMKQGSYSIREGDKVTTAIGISGGPTPIADLKRAVIKRRGTEIPVDLNALLLEGDMKQDLPLIDGDVFLIPSGTRIYVYGAVRQPGYVSLRDESGLMDVLGMVGGAAPNAGLDKAGVVRMVDGKPQVLRLDMKKAIEKGGPGRDFRFAQGDVLVIPEKGPGFQWQSALGTLSSLALLGTTFTR